jgi:alpha-beta hydrolase superfamily lysophospholipase
VILRGHAVEVYYQRHAASTPPRAKVIFLPGDGGWHGAAVTMGATMASWGYDVFALDTKSYLEAFTGTTNLQPRDVAGDLHAIAEWIAPGPGKRVILAGWSEGAGLAVLAAAAPQYQSKYSGLVTLGLSDSNVLGWRWSDDLTYLTKRPPNEPTFSCLALIPRVAPVPVVMLQSSHDEYVSPQESRQLFEAAAEPKRHVVIEARNHRFDGNLQEFYRRLQEALQWVEQAPS